MLAPSSRLFTRALPVRTLPTLPFRRPISTAPPSRKSRSWKSSATRWGLALGGIYYYNNSDIFAEEPPFSPSLAHPAAEDAPMPTLESLALQRTAASPLHSATPETALPQPSPNTTTAEPGFEETEEEAGQEGAFNEETGEINWDCACLGGMAHGPCGEEFRAAFSCFVYSKEEPKGMECIDRFKGMQDCFRRHPDTYGDELADPGPPDDEESEITGAVEGVAAIASMAPIPDAAPSSPSVASTTSSTDPSPPEPQTQPPAPFSSPTPSDADNHPAHTTDDASNTARARSAAEQVRDQPGDTGEGEDELVTKEWHDTTKLDEKK